MPNQPSPYSSVHSPDSQHLAPSTQDCSEITLTAQQIADLLDELAALYGATAAEVRHQTPTLNRFTNTLIHELQHLTGVQKVIGATKEIAPR